MRTSAIWKCLIPHSLPQLNYSDSDQRPHNYYTVPARCCHDSPKLCPNSARALPETPGRPCAQSWEDSSMTSVFYSANISKPWWLCIKILKVLVITPLYFIGLSWKWVRKRIWMIETTIVSINYCDTSQQSSTIFPMHVQLNRQILYKYTWYCMWQMLCVCVWNMVLDETTIAGIF